MEIEMEMIRKTKWKRLRNNEKEIEKEIDKEKEKDRILIDLIEGSAQVIHVLSTNTKKMLNFTSPFTIAPNGTLISI